MTSARNLMEALETAPAHRPFIVAWIDEDECETVTFGQFRSRARAQAANLARQNVTAGDRVVIIMPQGIPAMTAFVGAMMLGAVPAFLAYPNFKVEASKYRSGLTGVTANLRAKAVLIDNEFPDEMVGYIALPPQTSVIRASRERANIVDENYEVDSRELPPLAFIQHSAGTTGLQKGVALTHAAVLRQIEHLSGALKIDATTDRIYSWLPLYHDMGLIACFILPMVCHVPIVMQSPIDWVMRPETMLQIISEHKCTLAWLPNFAFQFVARRVSQGQSAHYDLRAVRAMINCSEPVRASSMEEFQKAFAASGLKPSALQSSYAMAENVFAVTQSDIDKPSGPARLWADAQQFRGARVISPVPEGTPGALRFTSSGHLLPRHRMQIVSDVGAPLPEGQVGEILLQSDCLFEGYYNRPDLTAKALMDGWCHTGDLGFYLAGELYVVGRKKDLIIVGGENFYPEDIEEIVTAHPAIHDGRAIALGLYNPEIGTEEIVVVAEVENESALECGGEIEREIRTLVVSAMGVAVRTIFLKPPKWIVKSTAGKPARHGTREKLLREHPDLKMESRESEVI